MVLLGIAPDAAEVEYGWIQPSEPIAGPSASQVYRVHRFPTIQFGSSLSLRRRVGSLSAPRPMDIAPPRPAYSPG